MRTSSLRSLKTGYIGDSSAETGAQNVKFFVGLRSDSTRANGLSHWAIFAFAVVLGAGAVLILDSQSIYVKLTIPGLVCLVLLVWAAWQTTINPFWLATALVLTETLPYINLIPADPESRWWLRYPMLLAFCLPAIVAAWRSGILKQGCFRWFLLYFGWGAVTVLYSLDPVVSGGRLLPAVLLFLALASVAASVNSADDVQRVFWHFLLGCGVLLCLTAFSATVLSVNIFKEGRDPSIGMYTWLLDMSGIMRFQGVFGTPNILGSLMLCTVGLSLALWKTTPGWRKCWLVFAMAAALTFAVMADSRSPTADIIAGVAIYSIWKYRTRAALVCVAIAIIAIFAYGTLSVTARTRLNRGVATFTGREAAWKFEIHKIAERPLFGYGYEVEGAIFQGPRFPVWNEFWNHGPNTSLHEGYFSVAIGMGLPALLAFLYLAFRPWFALFKRRDDPWNLKPVFFFVVLPIFLRGLDESGVAAPRYVIGLVFFLCWMLAERQRLMAVKAQVGEKRSSGEVDFVRLFSTAALGLSLIAVLILPIA